MRDPLPFLELDEIDVRLLWWMIRAAAAIVVCAVFVWSTWAHARDDGRYAQSPLKEWFDSLRSERGGMCCSQSDGEATEFELREDGYYAPIDGVMTRVPPDAVVKGPNRAGQAFKWLMYRDGKNTFRCFIPGPQM